MKRKEKETKKGANEERVKEGDEKNKKKQREREKREGN